MGGECGLLQLKLKLGIRREARLVDLLEPLP